jgi:glycosyltransferase involved in cell wall biosynthesis
MSVPEDFDPGWYASVFSDVGYSGLEPYEHYLRIGRELGRMGRASSLPFTQKDDPRRNEGNPIKLLAVSHDASQTGAPIVLLHLLRWLKNTGYFELGIILLGGGPLTNAFAALGSVHFTSDSSCVPAESFSAFHESKPDIVLLNTVVSGSLAQQFASMNIPTVAWIHERLESIQEFGWLPKLNAIIQHCSQIVAAGPAVFSDINSLFSSATCASRLRMMHEFIEPAPVSLDIPHSNEPTIWCCGTLEHRKGPDIAIDVAIELLKMNSKMPRIVWVGGSETKVDDYRAMARASGVAAAIDFVGTRNFPWEHYRYGDIFLLPSRHDPFPLAALEAARQGVPIVCSSLAGSMHEFVHANDAGLVSDSLAPRSLATLCHKLLADRSIRLTKGLNAAHAITRGYTVDSAAPLFEKAIRETIMAAQATVPSVLVISNGPPPVLREGQQSEGGGLRCWGLAYGLRCRLNRGNVALAFNQFYAGPNDRCEVDGVSLLSYTLDRLPDIIKAYDVIIVSFCMGDITNAVVSARRMGQVLVCDSYVPIHIEVSARLSANLGEEEAAYRADLPRWNKALLDADILLCASDKQKDYYTGVLAGLGGISPSRYANVSRKLLRVPYGIFEEPAVARSNPCRVLAPTAGFRLLWFGAVYPWFDIDALLGAAEILHRECNVHLIMVGYTNPFNCHPDFVAKGEAVRDAVENRGLGAFVHLHDWISFEERADWYLDADLIVTFNADGLENRFAWRTRLVDYVWSGAAIATNGGDPLGEDLIRRGAAARLNTSSAGHLSDDLRKLVRSPETLAGMRRQLCEYKSELYWSNVVHPLSSVLSEQAGKRL